MSDRTTFAMFGLGLTLLIGGALGGCAGDDVKGGPRENSHRGRDPLDPNNQYGGFNLFSTGNKSGQDAASQIGVNAYLWRGALETLKFMPLASADPFGGVIITDWWTPAASPAERFKATAYILGRQLRADGIRVSVFRQVNQGGQWVDAPVDPGKPTELENMVLAKARDLRSQAASGQ